MASGHVAYVCTKDHNYGCAYCDGGLFLCTKCMGLEGSLPTDCPGVKMSMETADEVYGRGVDYIKGKWVVLSTSQ